MSFERKMSYMKIICKQYRYYFLFEICTFFDNNLAMIIIQILILYMFVSLNIVNKSKCDHPSVINSHATINCKFYWKIFYIFSKQISGKIKLRCISSLFGKYFNFLVLETVELQENNILIL